jgi:hypothetical protein
MHHISQISQPNVGKSNIEYLKMLLSQILIINGHDIIFQIAKTYTMSEIYSRKTNTNSSCTRVYRDHKYFKVKKLSINFKKIGQLGSNVSFHLSVPVTSVPH